MDSRPVGLRKVSSTLASPGHLPPHLVHAAVMLVAEFDEVVQVGRPVVDPVHDVVHIGELRVRAAREPTSLVTSPDLDPLGVSGIPPGPSEAETLPARRVGGHQDLGVTGQPSGDLSGDRPQHVELGVSLAPGEEVHVGVDDDHRPIAAHARRPGLGSASRVSVGSIALAHGHQGIRHPLIERRPIPQTAAGPRDERALHRGVLILGEHAGQAAPPVVETEKTPGVEAGRPLVRFVPCGDRELPYLFGRPPGRLLRQRCVGLGPGHLDERLDLVEGELPLRQGIGDLGQRVELGRRGHPIVGRRRGHATSLDEPGDHGGGAVDPPGLAAIEFHHGGQQLALVGRDGPMMLRHTRHQALGSPGHDVGPGPVSKGCGGCHA